MNTAPSPCIDADALEIHASRLAPMTKAERDAYLDDFSGKQTPPPKKYDPKKVGQSLRALLGKEKIADLLVRADQIKTATSAQS